MRYTLNNNPSINSFCFVKAKKLTEDNFEEVASWAGVEEYWDTSCPRPALLGMTGPAGDYRHAYLGDYVVKTGERFVAMQRDLFEHLYSPTP